MPEHPHPPIEQRLRAAAEARRRAAGGPFVLHAADRRILQDEVARTFRQPALDPRPAWLVWLLRHRAGLAFYSALALVVMVCLPVMLGPRPAKEPVRPAPAPVNAIRPAMPLPAEQPRPEAATPPTVPAGAADKAASDLSVASSSPAPAAAPMLAERAARTDPTTLALRDSAAFSSETARTRSRQADAGGARLPVAESPTRSASAPPALVRATPGGEPLSRFRLERNGSNITVVDGDGSVYRGALLSESSPGRIDSIAARGLAGGATAAAAGGPSPEVAPRNERRYGLPVPAAASAPSQAFSFRVAGTNRTLRLPVQFQGSAPWPADRLNATQTWVRTVTSNLPPTLVTRRQTAPVANAGTNGALQGELQIGPAPPVRYEARPTSR